MQIDPGLVLSTPVCDVLGIHYPVLQAGMSVAGNGRLAAAVADAGGLGTIGSNPGGAAKDDQMAAVRQELRLARSITDGVISVNIPMVYGRGEELLEIAREEGAQAVSVTAGSPTTLAHSAHEYGLIVLGVVGSVAQAQKAQDAGVDVLVVEGTEAGGLNHPDCISVLPLLPKISDAVSTPLVAAGGFADGRGLAAALMLGASAVQMGTRFSRDRRVPYPPEQQAGDRRCRRGQHLPALGRPALPPAHPQHPLRQDYAGGGAQSGRDREAPSWWRRTDGRRPRSGCTHRRHELLPHRRHPTGRRDRPIRRTPGHHDAG